MNYWEKNRVYIQKSRFEDISSKEKKLPITKCSITVVPTGVGVEDFIILRENKMDSKTQSSITPRTPSELDWLGLFNRGALVFNPVQSWGDRVHFGSQQRLN